ncbi:hypothetical protein TWF506_003977 [Arthrobotrys conoides]|uniref:Uncharacterized protein n=1 Tax=Arthrobotrys conoides TaxID=74498 RepID=A0AAN8NKK5_9PEZI
MPDYTTSQIRDADPSPYDQIFLVTQDTINKTFKNIALAPPSSHQPSTQHNIYAGFIENLNKGVSEAQKWAKLPARATLAPVKPNESSQVHVQKITATIPRG